MKRILKLVIVVILLVAAVFVGRKIVLKRRADLRKEKVVVHYPFPVCVAKVKKASFVKFVRYLGKVDSNGMMELKARISGQVLRRIYLEGDTIRKGALLVALDGEHNGTVRELKAQVAVIRSKIASLRIQEKNLAAIYRRDTILYKNGAISEEAWELSENRLASVKGQITALKSEIAQIETKLTYTRIKSPFNGVLSQYYVKEGDVVFPGQPICQIIRSGSFKVKIEVTPDDLQTISVGSSVYVGDLALKVSRIYPAASRRSLAVIEADFGKTPCPFKVGEVIPVKIKSESLNDVWIVPVEAVLHKGNKALVFAVNRGKVDPIDVSVMGIGDVNSALASKGLKEGMPLICAHESRLMVLYKGQAVKITGEFTREASK